MLYTQQVQRREHVTGVDIHINYLLYNCTKLQVFFMTNYLKLIRNTFCKRRGSVGYVAPQYRVGVTWVPVCSPAPPVSIQASTAIIAPSFVRCKERYYAYGSWEEEESSSYNTVCLVSKQSRYVAASSKLTTNIYTVYLKPAGG